MGGGLGGGSSNAAAVLLALPVLAGAASSGTPERTRRGAGQRRALLPDGRRGAGHRPGHRVVSAPRSQTRASGRSLPACMSPPRRPIRPWARFDWNDSSSRINSFRAFVRVLASGRSAGAASPFSANDFEAVVFRQHPLLQTYRRKLSKLGAVRARMTGSGSAFFAVFGSRRGAGPRSGGVKGDQVSAVLVMPASLVSRKLTSRCGGASCASIWP